MKKLAHSFYLRHDVVQIAKDLLGKVLVTRWQDVLTTGRIVETEAYAGTIDKASHAYRGRTPRTAVMENGSYLMNQLRRERAREVLREVADLAALDAGGGLQLETRDDGPGVHGHDLGLGDRSFRGCHAPGHPFVHVLCPCGAERPILGRGAPLRGAGRSGPGAA